MQTPSEQLPRAAIVGLGITETGKVYGRSAADFAADAARRAVADAGLTLDDVDGLLVSSGLSGGVDIRLARQLGLTDLGILSQISQAGSTAIAQVQLAALAIAGGLATTVVCVHADAPLQPAQRSGDAYRRAAGPVATGFAGLGIVAGPRNPNSGYALAAQRHMSRFGTTSEQLGAIAVGAAAVGGRQPAGPLPRPDHARRPPGVAVGRRAVAPARLLHGVQRRRRRRRDVGRARRRPRRSRPCTCGAGRRPTPATACSAARTGASCPARRSPARRRWRWPASRPADIDVRAIYDCYTYTTLITLEDYGFCAKGEGGELAASGALGPGGDLPTNTGGGQLSSFYLWGMTPLSEAVIQVRGQGGERQVAAPRRGRRQRQRRRPRLPQHARRRHPAALTEAR